jgi:ATP-dependent exoDNAse (exonuclease V) alpha subunit
VKFSPSQARALDAITAWLRDPHRKPTFYLAGLAGSGKSTILKHAIQDLRGKICYVAPTGKAALVMRRKGVPTAGTIHSLIYTVAGGDPMSPEALAKLREEMKRLRAIPEPGAQKTAEQIAKQLERAEQDQDNKGPRFSLNRNSDLATAALGVVDEVSMVDDRIGRDLESFGVPLLVVGDPAQLPPVYGAGYFTSREPDAYLGEIHRQALDSPILRLADLARRGERLPVGQIGDGVDVRRYGDPTLEARATTAEMILVGRNRTRHACNAKIRRLLGRGGEPAPVAGDRVVGLRNDHEIGLLNGSTWVVDRCVPDLDKMTAKIEVTSTDDATDKIETTTWLHPFMAREDELVGRHDRRTRSEFTYAYALTVHKSQGSAFDDVLLFDESRQFGKDACRHLYTGLTRAARTLTVVVQ